MSGDQLNLDAIEARANAASPGPWAYPGIDSVAGGTLYDKTRRIVDVVYEQPEDHDGQIVRHLLVPEADANGEFIAHAREDVPALVAEVRRLQAIVGRVEALEPDWSDIGQVHTAADLRDALDGP